MLNNRWFQLVASLIAMIMIANLQYSWTLFVKPPPGRPRLEAVGRAVGLHAVHPVSDLGAAARRLAHRSHGPARVHQRRRRAVRRRLGRARLRHDAADALYALRRRGHRRRVRLQRVDRVGAEVVPGPPRAGGRHHGGGIRRRHGALHPGDRLHDSDARLQNGVPLDRRDSGRRDLHRRAVPATSAADRTCAGRPVAAASDGAPGAISSRRARCCARRSSTCSTRCS